MDGRDVRYLENPDRLSAYIQLAGARGFVALLCPPTGETEWERFPTSVLARCKPVISIDPGLQACPRRFPPLTGAP